MRAGRIVSCSAAENALRARPNVEEALKNEEIKKLKQKIGDFVMDLEILQTAIDDTASSVTHRKQFNNWPKVA